MFVFHGLYKYAFQEIVNLFTFYAGSWFPFLHTSLKSFLDEKKIGKLNSEA